MPISGAVNPASNDVSLDTSRGVINGRRSINSVGRAFGVDGNERVIGGVVAFAGFLTSADTLRAAAGGSPDDDASGTGSRSLHYFGLDQNFNLAEEIRDTNGASASASTTITFIRLFWVRAVGSGTYSSGLNGSNAGNIVIETTGGIVMETIIQGVGITQSSARTIPAGFTGFLVSLSGQVDGDKTGTIKVWGRGGADTTVAPFQSRIELGGIPNIVGREGKPLKTYPPIQEKTDIWATAVRTEGGSPTSAGVDYQLILIANNS